MMFCRFIDFVEEYIPNLTWFERILLSVALWGLILWPFLR